MTISAFFTALIWLVTPLNSMAVIYVVQRMTLLMTLFFLLSFLAYIIARKSAKAPSWFLLSFIFLVFSFLSKENGITIILVIILYEFIFNKKGELKNITKTEFFVLFALFIMLLIPIIVYRSAIYDNFTTADYKRWGFTLGERYLSECRALVFGLSLLLLPLPQRLSITHDIAVSKSFFSPITTMPAIFLITALFVFSLVRMKKNPYFSFAVLFFFATMSVEAIMPIDLFFEHRMYLPSIFLIGVLVDFVTNKYYDKCKKFVVSAFLIIALLFSVLTVVRSQAWKSEVTLWSDTLSKYPNDNRAIYNFGAAYFKKGDYKKALEYYKKALEMRLKLYGEEHEGVANSDNSIGICYSRLGDYAKALEFGKKALEIRLKLYGEEHKGVASSYNSIGIALYGLGDYKKALEYYDKALNVTFKLYGKEHPDVASGYSNIGLTWYALGDNNKALEYYEKALNVNLKLYGEGHPDVAGAYSDIGRVWYDLGDYRKALEYGEKAYAIYVKLFGKEYLTAKQIKMDMEITKEKMKAKQ